MKTALDYDIPFKNQPITALPSMRPDPTLVESFMANMRVNNPWINLSSRMGAFQGDWAATLGFTRPEEGFEPYELIRGTKYEAYADSFANARNSGDVYAIMSLVDQEEIDRSIAADDPLLAAWTGLASGVLDPWNLVSFKGAFTAASAIKGVGKRWAAGTALHTAMGGLGALPSEAMLSAYSPTRTADEFKSGVAASMVFSGLLGSAVSWLPRADAHVAANAVKEDILGDPTIIEGPNRARFRQFWIDDAGVSEADVDAALSFMEGGFLQRWAERTGDNSESFYEKHLSELRSYTPEQLTDAAKAGDEIAARIIQESEGDAFRGVTVFEDGKAVVAAIKGSADVSTMLHEIGGHVFLRQLDEGDIRLLGEHYGMEDFQEAFVKDFERFLQEPVGEWLPSPIKKVMQYIRKKLVQIYGVIKEAGEDAEIAPAVREVLERNWLPEEIEKYPWLMQQKNAIALVEGANREPVPEPSMYDSWSKQQLEDECLYRGILHHKKTSSSYKKNTRSRLIRMLKEYDSQESAQIDVDAELDALEIPEEFRPGKRKPDSFERWAKRRKLFERDLLFQKEALVKGDEYKENGVWKKLEDGHASALAPQWAMKRLGQLSQIPSIKVYSAIHSDIGKRIAERLINIPFLQIKNKYGIATPDSVDYKAARHTLRSLYGALGPINHEFAKYRARMSGKSIPEKATTGRLAIIKTSDLFRRSEDGPMKAHEFRRSIWDEWGGKDTGVPEAAAAANAIRKVMDEIAERLTERKLIPQETRELIKRGLGHRPRVWSQWAVRKHLGVLKKIIRKQIELGNLKIDQEKVSIDEAISRILHTNTGYLWNELSYDPRIDAEINLAGFLRTKMFDFPDEFLTGVKVGNEVIDFIETDPETILRSYFNSVIPDIHLSTEFGDVSMKDQLQEVLDEYNALIDSAEGSTEDLVKEMNLILDNIIAFRDIIRHTYAPPRNPGGFGARAGSALLKYNTLAYLGNVTIASISDVARPIMRYGLEPFAKTLSAYAGDKEFFNGMKDFLAEIGAVTDLVTSIRIEEFADLTDLKSGKSGIERAIDFGTDHFGVLSLIDYWNASMKTLAGITATQEIVKAGMKIYNAMQGALEHEFADVERINSIIGQKEMEQLAKTGLSAHDLYRIAELTQKHGEQHKGALWLPQVQKWGTELDVSAIRDRFEGAIFREVESQIVTPHVGDKPLFAHTPLGRLTLQFKSFAFAAVTKVVMAGLEQGDARFYSGLLIATFFGGIAYGAKQMARGEELTSHPGEFVLESIDNAGLLGIAMDFNGMLEQLTRGKVGLHPIFGGEGALSRFRGKNIGEIAFGPSYSTGQNAMGTMSGFVDGILSRGMNDYELNATFKTLPYSRLFYLRRTLFDPMHEASKQWIGRDE